MLLILVVQMTVNSLGLSLLFCTMKEPDYIITKVPFSSKLYDTVISTGIHGYHLKFSILQHLFKHSDPKTAATSGFLVSVNGSIDLKLTLA